MIARDRFPVQGPLDLDRVIPLQYRARCGHGVPPIRWSLSDHEWYDSGRNCRSPQQQTHLTDDMKGNGERPPWDTYIAELD